MREALIEADGLGMRYTTGRLALKDVSLTVHPGELAVVLGANGSGKSTLLRIIAGIIKPTEGRARIAGREITRLTGGRLAEARMAAGVVFQHANLVKRRSVLANVLCGTLGRNLSVATALGMLPKREIPYCMHCLANVGLQEFAMQRASTLSGGQAQRAAIARALAQRPLALLADEPVASLDPEATNQVMRLLKHLAANQGMAVLCVLHQPDLARFYADRIIGLRRGAVTLAARPDELSESAIAALYEEAG
jgi:phosphonate transport system ATP-binding protein